MPPHRKALTRFWEKVDRSGECWVWVGKTMAWGYGRFYPRSGKYVYAHRFVYELMVGPIPDGMQIDHLCRNRACVRPAHLEAVSQRENIVRGMGWAGVKARQTHCKRGHELTPENIYRQPSRPNHRACLICEQQRHNYKPART